MKSHKVMVEAVQTFRMYICMYVSYASVDESVFMYVSYASVDESLFMYVCTYVCIYVGMSVCTELLSIKMRLSMYVQRVSLATVDKSEAEHVYVFCYYIKCTSLSHFQI